MNAALRHMLATLAYRTRKALDSAPAGFAGFDAGSGMRTPVEILSHISDVLAFTCAELDSETTANPAEDVGPWADEETRFIEVLHELDRILLDVEVEPETTARILQGPLSDAMTHAGQLCMMRRMAGAPIPPENFFAADIRPGIF